MEGGWDEYFFSPPVPAGKKGQRASPGGKTTSASGVGEQSFGDTLKS